MPNVSCQRARSLGHPRKSLWCVWHWLLNTRYEYFFQMNCTVTNIISRLRYQQPGDLQHTIEAMYRKSWNGWKAGFCLVLKQSRPNEDMLWLRDEIRRCYVLSLIWDGQGRLCLFLSFSNNTKVCGRNTTLRDRILLCAMYDLLFPLPPLLSKVNLGVCKGFKD